MENSVENSSDQDISSIHVGFLCFNCSFFRFQIDLLILNKFLLINITIRSFLRPKVKKRGGIIYIFCIKNLNKPACTIIT